MTSYFRERYTATKLWLAAAALVAVLLLAACGVTTSPGVGGGLQSSTPTKAAATTAKNPPASTSSGNASGPLGLGCTGPASRVVANAQVMLQPTQMNGVTTVAVGQSVGVNLPAKLHWTLQVKDPTGALTLTTPQGILDTTHNTCDWRFDTAHTGTVTISFVGIFKCSPNSMCPEIALDYSYSLNIH